ncbi:MAG TPA: GNAT family N-acetyltransferase [Woeseiaceae bacterium]|jgi:GNAT superfamily N-acetyltransferase|nr:GNAT family N-acetyltransferase [Woeseiaceae bacterium]
MHRTRFADSGRFVPDDTTAPRRWLRGHYAIGRAERRHVSQITGLEQAAAALFPVEDLPAPLRYRVTARDVLDEAQEVGRLWVAQDDSDRAVGFALADVVDGEAYLTEVDVHPEHARRGLGTRLVASVARWAEEEGFRSLLLVTFRHLPWNAPFYRKLGFVPVPEGEMGSELREIFAEEACAGIDTCKRIAMRLMLPCPSA